MYSENFTRFCSLPGLAFIGQILLPSCLQANAPGCKKGDTENHEHVEARVPKMGKTSEGRTQLVVLKERSWKDALFNMPAVSKYFQLASLENISQEEVQFSPRP